MVRRRHDRFRGFWWIVLVVLASGALGWAAHRRSQAVAAAWRWRRRPQGPAVTPSTRARAAAAARE